MPTKKTSSRTRDNTIKATRSSKLSPQRQPTDMSAQAWQTQLRQQFGRVQTFKLENTGTEVFFSEFTVTNPQSNNSYRVAIRGAQPGDNFCSCPDFATNDLGTCKHVEFVLGKLEKKRGGKRSLQAGFQPAYSEIYLRYGAERQVQFRAGTTCPSRLVKLATSIFSSPSTTASTTARFARLDELLSSAARSDHELRCYEDALHFIAQARDAEQRQQRIAVEYPQGIASPALHSLLRTTLYPYQAEGALFAVRAGRCLIGDEMGLGKTIQAIAAMELFARHFGVERVLIVCPTSLKHQWQREIARFTQREAQVSTGNRAARLQHYLQAGFCKITNYEKLETDLEFIRSWSPELVIVDEAQRIKNWNTIAARSLKRIESPYAIVLTGTPLENRLEELISIVQFVDQHRLGPTWRLRQSHQLIDNTGRVIGYRDLGQIGKTLQPVLLRRRKSEVLTQLPARVDNTLFVTMTAEQQALHRDYATVVQQIVQRWRRSHFLSDVDQRRLMCALQSMRMSCNSTYLLDGKTDHGTKVDELLTLLEELFERADTKVVIFSQWLRTHELIIRRLQRKRWGHVLFHGGVPGDKRGELVERFHNDAQCRVFLSTDAGGVGLNLQHAASVIVNMDMPWNPAVLEQRIGRVHRLGQIHGVQVVNFVAEGTIEENMLSVLAFKKSLFEGALDGGAQEVFMGGSRLNKFMESVVTITQPDTAATTSTNADAETTPSATINQTAQSPAVGTAAATAPVNHTAAVENPLTSLLTIGLQLVKAMSSPDSNGTSGTLIETDAATGQTYLKLPVPEPAVVQQLGEALIKLLASMQKL